MKIADLHQDILISGEDIKEVFQNLYRVGYRLVVAVVFPVSGNRVWEFDDILEGVKKYKAAMDKNTNLLTNWFDLNENSLNIIIGLEGGYLNDLKYYERLYKEGVRLFGLTWNIPSKLSGSCENGEGLTSLGVEFLHWAKEKGVLVDLAHASYNAILQTVELYKGSIYSHGGILKNPKNMRNLNYEIAKAIYDNGGVLGLGYGHLFFEKRVDIYEIADTIINLSEVFKGGIVSGSDFYGLGKSNIVSCLEYPKQIKNLAKLLPEETLKSYFWENFSNFLRNFGKTSSIKAGP